MLVGFHSPPSPMDLVAQVRNPNLASKQHRPHDSKLPLVSHIYINLVPNQSSKTSYTLDRRGSCCRFCLSLCFGHQPFDNFGSGLVLRNLSSQGLGKQTQRITCLSSCQLRLQQGYKKNIYIPRGSMYGIFTYIDP